MIGELFILICLACMLEWIFCVYISFLWPVHPSLFHFFLIFKLNCSQKITCIVGKANCTKGGLPDHTHVYFTKVVSRSSTFWGQVTRENINKTWIFSLTIHVVAFLIWAVPIIRGNKVKFYTLLYDIIEESEIYYSVIYRILTKLGLRSAIWLVYMLLISIKFITYFVW